MDFILIKFYEILIKSYEKFSIYNYQFSKQKKFFNDVK